jgi:hypothetical protein
MHQLSALVVALAVTGCDSTADLGRTSAAPICSSASPCPSGMVCINGLCAAGCQADEDCAAEQYCDTQFDRLCHGQAVTTCPATACAASQVCLAGLCSTPAPPTPCTRSLDGHDGCDQYSICFEEAENQNRCHTFPPCPEDGHCPVGTSGAVCNEGDLSGKAHICLTGMCKTPAHCPSGFRCLLPGFSPLGLCSDGRLAMPCLAPADCQAGLTCAGALAGMPGFCIPGVGGAGAPGDGVPLVGRSRR